MCLHCAKSAMEINGNNVKKRGRGEMKGDKRKRKNEGVLCRDG